MVDSKQLAGRLRKPGIRRFFTRTSGGVRGQNEARGRPLWPQGSVASLRCIFRGCRRTCLRRAVPVLWRAELRNALVTQQNGADLAMLERPLCESEKLEPGTSAQVACRRGSLRAWPLHVRGGSECPYLKKLSNFQITQKAPVPEEQLHRWKSLGDSTEDRAVADCDVSKITFSQLLTQVRERQDGLAALLVLIVHANTIDTLSAGSRSVDSPGGGHFQVAVRLGRSRTQS